MGRNKEVMLPTHRLYMWLTEPNLSVKISVEKSAVCVIWLVFFKKVAHSSLTSNLPGYNLEIYIFNYFQGDSQEHSTSRVTDDNSITAWRLPFILFLENNSNKPIYLKMEDKLRAKEGFKSTKWMPWEAKIPSPTSMCNFPKCRFINTHSQTWEREETYRGAVSGNLHLSYGSHSTAGRENSVRNGWCSHDVIWRVTNRLPLLFVPLCISAFRTRASTGQYNEHWITGKRRIFFFLQQTPYTDLF